MMAAMSNADVDQPHGVVLHSPTLTVVYAGSELAAALAALTDTIGDVPDDPAHDPERAAVAALLAAVGVMPEVHMVEYRGPGAPRQWVPPHPCRPEHYVELLVPPATPAVLIARALDWCVAAFATIALVAQDMFPDPDAPNAAVRAAIRDVSRVAAMLPEGPATIVSTLWQPTPQPGALLSPAVYAQLCPPPAVGVAFSTLADMLDPATFTQLQRYIDQLGDDCLRR